MERRTVQFEILKTDDAAHTVYGWASVVEKANGSCVVDRQGDVILAEDLELAAADFVKHYRQGGEDHAGLAKNTLVASVVMTREVQKAMGLAEGALPVGWFVGFELAPDSYARVAKGQLLMFSIEGESDTETIDVGAAA